MELSDEKLRQIVHETLRDLGDDAAPELVRKVVRAVIHRLQLQERPARQLPIIETPAQPMTGKKDGAAPGY